MKYLRLVLSNLRRKWLRTALTVLCILVAFLLFGYLATFRVAFNQGIDVAGQDRLVVRHKVSLIQPLPAAYEARIERIDGVDSAIHQTWFGGTYQDPKNFFAQFPVVPDEFLDMYPEYLLDDAEKQAWSTTRTGAVVGRLTAERFGWEIGDRIPLFSSIWTQKDGSQTWEFDLVGIYEGAEKGTDASLFFFRHDYFDEGRVFGEGLVGWYVVRVDDPQRAAEIAEAIDREFANSPAETKAEAEGAFYQGFAKQVGDVGQIIFWILAAVFFTILLVAGNTMAQSVRERVNELGVLKAVGFTDRGVLALVLAESSLIALIGGVLGLALAWMLVTAFGDPTPFRAFPVFYLPVRDLVVGLVLALAVGLGTGLLPALQAQRMQIADALRR